MSAKVCFKCRLEKPLAEFYVHPAMGDGRLNKCKVCTRLDVKANYYANHGRIKEYEKQRATLPHRVAAREEYARSERGKEAHRRSNRKYNKSMGCLESKRRFIGRNPVKHAAHIATGNAIRDGRLIRQPCEVCGAEKAQAHHDDYSKPLDVRWLCTTHHAEWHRHNTPICPAQEQAA